MSTVNHICNSIFPRKSKAQKQDVIQGILVNDKEKLLLILVQPQLWQ